MTKQWDENFQLHSTAMFSEAWKDELKELAAKVSLSSQLPKGKKEVQVLLKLKIYPVFNSFNRSMNILVISIISLAEYNLFGWDVENCCPLTIITKSSAFIIHTDCIHHVPSNYIFYFAFLREKRLSSRLTLSGNRYCLRLNTNQQNIINPVAWLKSLANHGQGPSDLLY